MLDRDTNTLRRSDPVSASTGDREFKFGDADFRAIAGILKEEAGINLPDGKAPLVYARLVKRLRNLNLSGFSEYVALLRGPNSTDERRYMLTALTTNVTRFFREPHHFEHLRANVLAPLAQHRDRARVRIWSAACSTGQEPYSIAAVIADSLSDAARSDLKILATDIDPTVIEHARTGRYDSIDGVPPQLRRWFERDGDSWLVSPTLQSLVTFKLLNLNSTWPFRGPFDAIFCRNVAIYFDQEVQARLWSSFANVISANGTIYIGHSERISGPASNAFENIGITTYRRRGANE